MSFHSTQRDFIKDTFNFQSEPMGLAKSKPFCILVIGLRNAGKTHFLDMFHMGSDTTKVPTFGYHETVIKHCNKQEVVFTEYGSNIKWTTVFKGCKHSFDAIFMIIRSDFSAEEVMESNNALLMMTELLPDAPVAIIWNLVGELPGNLQWVPRSSPSCTCYLDFTKIDWRERVSELLEWTIANTRIAKQKAK